jgi:VanZ family protein
MIVIVFLSLLPGTDIPTPSFLRIPYFDKIVHFFMYFIFALLIIYGYLKYTKGNLRKKHIIISFIIVVFWGGLMELLQGIFQFSLGRSMDLIDFIANLTGSLVAILTFYITSKFWLKQNINNNRLSENSSNK